MILTGIHRDVRTRSINFQQAVYIWWLHRCYKEVHCEEGAGSVLTV